MNNAPRKENFSYSVSVSAKFIQFIAKSLLKELESWKRIVSTLPPQ
jgi:hypothetical protein